MQQDSLPILKLGQQLEDGSYFMGVKTNVKGNKEALLLFLNNAEDIQDKGLMFKDEAIKAFGTSKGIKNADGEIIYVASKFQEVEDIENNETDGGIRQFIGDEWRIIIPNFQGNRKEMAEIWFLFQRSVREQGDVYVQTPDYIPYEDVLTVGKEYERVSDVSELCLTYFWSPDEKTAVVSARTATQEMLPQYKFPG